MRKVFQTITAGLFSGVILSIFLSGTVTADNNAEIHRLINSFTTAVTKNDVAIAAKKVSAFGPEAVPLLIEALSPMEYRSRYGAVQSLGLINDERVIDALGEMLAQMPEQYPAGYGHIPEDMAIEILEQRGPDGIRGLVRALQTRDDFVKMKVVEALGRSNNPNAVPVLISVLPHRNAVVALGKLKDPRAVEALVSLLPLYEAIISLGEIKDPRAIVPLLREIYKKPNEVNAEYLLAGNFPSNISIEKKRNLINNIPLITELKKSRNKVIEDALSELGFPLHPKLYEIAAGIPTNIDLAQQQALFADHLISLLVSQKLEERYLAEFVIARIDRLMEPSLIKALNNSNNMHLRKAVAEQMGKMQGPNIENALVNALTDQNPLVVAYAARALGELRSQSALEPLKKIAIGGSLFERRGAVWAITKIGYPAGKAFLKELCNDKDEYVRRIATSN
ncbi:MAG: HEAT repeat domain-containing protein [Geobacteraceae bacterium]|nr:HEAT repeat domain-containing protein [Geobacteraceae bacterium]